ncbi:hypothetical protein JCM3774_006158 [Rhodotorula dairenensis]
MADSKSRKRQKGPLGQPINLAVHHTQPGELRPALALYTSARPPAKTPYTLYTRAGESSASTSVLAAETDSIEFDSRNQLGVDKDGEDAGHAVQYMIGVRNPRTNTLTLHAAPLHTITPTIKAFKRLASDSAASETALIMQQRAALGSTFGTKKAIKQLRAQERNKLNETSFGVGAHVAGLQSHLTQSIEAASSNLPTLADVEHTANESRPIPPFDIKADKPSKVYDFDAVVSRAELNAIDLAPYIAAPDFKERRQLLAYRRSDFVAAKMKQILPARASAEGQVPNPSQNDRVRLKLVIYLAYLLQFRQVARPGQLIDRSKLVEKLANPPAVIVDSLLERFAEPVKGADARKVTSVMELKLLAYLLVVVLRVDGWSTDVTTMADDLGMGSRRVQELFRSLGCVLVAPSAEDREKLVATGRAATSAEAAKSKKAKLKVPLEFPKERKMKAKR